MKNCNTFLLSILALFTFGLSFAESEVEFQTTKVTDSTVIKFKNSVHLVAEISNSNPSLKETIVLTFKMYVSSDVGIEKWDKLSQPLYTDFDAENIDIGNLKIETTTYNGKNYRYVVLQQIKLTPKTIGEFTVNPLELDVTGSVSHEDKRDLFGKLLMEQLTESFKTNSVTINVRS